MTSSRIRPAATGSRSRVSRSSVLRRALSALVLLLVLAAGCGGDDELGSGDLVWEKKPRVFKNPNLPDDRILTGMVRNDSLEVVNLVARELGVRTDGGDEMVSAAIFSPTFIRGVFPQNRGDEIPASEQLRIGLRARLEPGKTAPLTVSWRQHGKRAVLVDYGAGALPVPGR
jgi:hypothetical protein